MAVNRGKRHKIIRRVRNLALGLALVSACCAITLLLLSSQGVSSSESKRPVTEKHSARTNVPSTYPDRVDDVLARFMEDWSQSPPKDRAAMARFFGYFQYGPSLELLRREAGKLYGESAVASVQALAALGDLEALPVFREIVRSPVSPDAIKVAVEAMGTWRDHHSYSSLILTLLDPHCEGPCVVSMVRSMVRMRHPFLAQYLYLIHQVSSSSTARLASAAAMTILDDKLRWDKSVVSTLRDAAYAPDLDDLASDPWQEQRFVLGLWGAGRLSNAHCKKARDNALGLLNDAPHDAGPTLAAGIIMANLPCIRSNTAKGRELQARLVGIAGTLAPGAGASRLPVLGDARALPFEDPPWVDWLVQLASRFAVWQSTPSVAGFAQAIEQLEEAQTRKASLTPSQHLVVDGDVRVPKGNWRKLKKTASAFEPPEDFDSYDFTTGQPDWWPSWIEFTVDDGPRPKRLTAILDVLAKRKLKATFFFIGVNVVRNWLPNPAETTALLNRVLDEGHRIGYHSMSHETGWFRHLQFWHPLQIKDDVELYRRVLSMALGKPWTGQLARLPGGMGRNLLHVRYGLHLGGLKGHIHWHLEDENWGPSTRLVKLKFLAKRLVADGKPTVILLHETGNVARQLEYFIETVYQEVHSEKTAQN